MKTLLRAISLHALVVLVVVLAGCASNGGTSNTAEMGQTLYQQLGGADGVTRLANQFGANIASNPTLNMILDSITIGNIQTGFTNDVMRSSGMTPVSETSMASALEGKHLDATALTALSNSLKEAGASLGINPSLVGQVNATVIQPLQSRMGM